MIYYSRVPKGRSDALWHISFSVVECVMNSSKLLVNYTKKDLSEEQQQAEKAQFDDYLARATLPTNEEAQRIFASLPHEGEDEVPQDIREAFNLLLDKAPN